MAGIVGGGGRRRPGRDLPWLLPSRNRSDGYCYRSGADCAGSGRFQMLGDWLAKRADKRIAHCRLNV